MILPGIKLGPQNWTANLYESNAKYAEVWYRVDWEDRYRDMFRAIRKEGVHFGLHYWGVTSSGHESNICYPGQLATESVSMIKRCLDVAEASGATYVNIHSGTRCACLLNFEERTVTPDDTYPIISDEDSRSVRDRSLEDLCAHARSRGVHLLVEPIPARLPIGDYCSLEARLNTRPTNETSLFGLTSFFEKNDLGFTNDFCHLFGLQYDKSREKLYRAFLETTNAFAPYTFVIHINTIIAPYNGTDCHCGILPEDLAAPSVFPTRSEWKLLFHLFSKQPHDIWAIGEPKENHVENYWELCDLLLEDCGGEEDSRPKEIIEGDTT